jgi:hypothetical protein
VVDDVGGVVVSMAWSDVLSTVLDGAGIVDSEVLQTVRNEYYSRKSCVNKV